MPEETVHEVRVSLARERPPIRHAHLHMTGTDVTFGVPGWQGDRLEADPAQAETIERVNAMHVKACPNARSVMAAIDIETNVEIVPAARPAEVAS